MARYHTTTEIRRYDLMKLGVLLLLLVLLFLTWYATRDDGSGVAGEPPPTVVAGAGDDTGGAILPVPTLGVPSLTQPAGPVAPGLVTLGGTAGPGAQVAVLANGVSIGVANAGVDGTWSLAAELPAGDYTLVAQTLDNVGRVVAEAQPVTLTVGEGVVSATAAPGAPLNPPAFDALRETWELGGTAAPGQTVTVLSNGAVVGATTAGDAGNWQLSVPADSVTGDLVVQLTDAAGTTTQSEPVKPGARPPSIVPPGELTTSPTTGAEAVAIPAGGYTWTGQGQPGAQVEIIANGQSLGMTTVDAGGNWTLVTQLPDGEYEVQLNTLDPSGSLLAQARPIIIIVGVPAVAEGAATPVAPTGDTIAALLAGQPDLSTLGSALGVAGLGETFAEPGPYTLFAPTNDAFAALPESVVEALLANPQALSQLLQYHALMGRSTIADLRVVQPATLNSRLLTFAPQGDSLSVNGATILTADVDAGNGIVHVIDRVLLPPLAVGVRPPVIDESGVPTFAGPALTVIGTAEPGRTILVELNGEPFGAPATVDANGNWAVAGDVGPGDYRIVAFMLNGATLEAIAPPVSLLVQ